MVAFRLHNGSTVKVDAFDRLGRCDWLAVAAVDGEKILWACEADPVFCSRHGFDLRDPTSHEIFNTDFAADVGPQAPPRRFLKLDPIDPKEQRLDPASGTPCSFA